MDTDDLTPMAYETISRAGDVLDVLRDEIGASARDQETEDDFLREVRAHVRGVLRSARDYLDDWNCVDTVNVRDFRKGVTKLLDHVDTTLATPYEQRGRRSFKRAPRSPGHRREGVAGRAITYTNRKGVTYFLCQGVTKTGKPRYYFAREPKSIPVTQLPDGCRIEESVNGVVSLSKIRPMLLRDEEIEVVNTALKKHPEASNYRVDAKHNRITVYVGVGPNVMDLAELIADATGGRALDPAILRRLQAEQERRGQFMPMMRFTLSDEKRRYFNAERMCFSGAIDDWIIIGYNKALAKLTSKLIPTLGTDQFFELF